MKVDFGKYKELDTSEIIKILKDEGFRRVYEWYDPPHTKYPDHTHSYYSAHIVVDGEIKIIAGGKEYVFSKGDRFDVEEGEIHAAEAGKNGCRYIVGEK